MDKKYTVLDGQQPYPLAARTSRRVKKLRELQVSSAYYSERDRYGIAKEMCMDAWIVSETEDADNGTVTFDMKAPEIGADEFRDKVAALLFPEAPVEDHADDINYDAVEDALEAFLGFIEPRHRRRAASLPWQTLFQSAQTSNTNISAEETPSLQKETPTQGT